MKNWTSVEEKWREQLQNKSEDLPEGLWSRLEERLEEKPTRRFPIYWAAAAMLLIAMGLSWNWNAAPEKAAVVAMIGKASSPAEIAISKPSSSIISVREIGAPILKGPKPILETEPSNTPEAASTEQAPAEQIAAAAPVVENKSIPDEVITVRLDIDPVLDAPKPVANLKRKKSLFGKIIREIGQVLDGESVNWQQLKEGNPAFENNIHNVANTYVKTEEHVKRTLQIQ